MARPHHAGDEVCDPRLPWATRTSLRRSLTDGPCDLRTARTERTEGRLIGFSAQHCRAGCSAEFLAPARWAGALWSDEVIQVAIRLRSAKAARAQIGTHTPER